MGWSPGAVCRYPVQRGQHSTLLACFFRTPSTSDTLQQRILSGYSTALGPQGGSEGEHWQRPHKQDPSPAATAQPGTGTGGLQGPVA